MNAPSLYTYSTISMDTQVRLQVAIAEPEEAVWERAQRAFRWFLYTERVCSRFEEDSELCQLSSHVGQSVRVSELLFRALSFALEVARLTEGAFDPTVGRSMEARGFNRSYLTGREIASPPALNGGNPSERSSFKDVSLNPQTREVRLHAPLRLDLGAVAKGLAMDLAVRELEGFTSFVVDAGGDIYAKGNHSSGRPWRVGIRQPRSAGEMLRVLDVSDAAVCTSGDYERSGPGGDAQHHLLDPSTGSSTDGVASVTVVAPTAMLTDTLSTAAFILGVQRGLAFLERQGVEGVMVTSSLETHTARHFARHFQ